jgi:hypothetical protein
MHVVRTFRMSAAVVAATLAVGAVGTSAAEAKPTRPGSVSGLAAVVTPHDTSYDVAATWNATPNATSYRVALTKGGTTLASASVKTTSWSKTVTTSPGTASLSVRAVITRKPGKPTSISVVLPDATAPQGSYSSTWDNDTGLATITQDSLTDNVPVSGVTRTVDWGEGAPVAWPTGTTITHTYPVAAARFTPTVTLEDAAHNVAVIDVPAIVLEDSLAPTGSFSVAPATAWARFTTVSVTQQGDLADNWSPTDHIGRSIAWGDGTTTDWTSAVPATHVYATAGSYTPIVTITDEAHNANPVSTSAVQVTADTGRPTVRLKLPRAKHSVRAWRTLRGKATDAETAVATVTLRAVEKRGGSWFGYNAAGHRWVKAGSKAKAFSRATPFVLTTDARHRWAARLARLRKGTLVYKVRATDVAGNRSATVTHRATLTRR